MRLVIVSNRVPVPSRTAKAGGLTVALRDALSERSGVWFGWNGGQASPRAEQPTVVREGNIDFATVPLDEQDLENYYRGYANSVLWPLFHERLDAIDHREAFRASYADVNAYLADGLAPMIEGDDVVWVQDYHLIPMGSELRARGFEGRMGFFLHTPFPPFDIFRVLPGRSDLLAAFPAYDLVGLQTATDVRHFAEVLRQHGAQVDESAGVAELDGRSFEFGAFPIGIDVERTAEIARANRDTRAAHELAAMKEDRKLVIGADRLDYTKGIIKRLRAFDRFLDRYHDELAHQTVYIQIAAPSRENVEEYQAMKRSVATEAGRINGRTNQIGWTPFHLITRGVPREALLGYFSLADVGLVTPLRDGMNLVAKEFLASQPSDDPGVLVLSSLAGAAEELSDCAVIVNPYDIDGVASGIRRALAMPAVERRRRWELGMERLHSNTAQDWRNRFLDALADAQDPPENKGSRQIWSLPAEGGRQRKITLEKPVSPSEFHQGPPARRRDPA